jgi:Xaa-Pro dipeptidase
MFETRLKALKELQIGHSLNCLALVPGANLFYLTGVQKFLSERPIVAFLPVENVPILLLPAFEAAGLEKAMTFEARFYTYTDEQGYAGALARACRELNLGGARLGVEYLTMRVLERQIIAEAAPNVRFENADGLMTTLRVRKDATEVEAMTKAARINEQAFRHLMQVIRPGQTEKQLATAYQIAAWQAGAEGFAFDPLIVAGPNAASAHSYPSDRPIRDGELVVVDCGVRYGGYCSDITRTLAVGSVSAEWAHIYETVRRANEAGRAFARPGVTAQEVDRVTRKVIREAGYGEYFTHRTGHGLGLEVHEFPYIVEGSDLILQSGMVFTVEPGIYIPGLGGVRIEDNVLLTETGATTLTDLPRDLTFL